MEEEQIKLSVFDDFVRIMKGNISGGMWLALFVVSLLAILVSIRAHYNNKGKKNELTPEKFSWIYALIDNFWRIITGMIVMFFIYRFASILVNSSWLANEDIFLFLAVGVGFGMSYGMDKIIQYLQARSNFLQVNNPYTEVKKELIEQQKKG